VSREPTHDVAVVGGGLAGLSAARSLSEAGFDPLVLEARDRVGGKTHSAQTDAGDVFEYGGQWVGADQDRVLALVDELGLETRPQYDEGAVITRLDGERTVAGDYEEALASIGEPGAKELEAAFAELERCVEQVPRENPQDTPQAEAWDATTLKSWADDWFDSPAAQATFERMVPGIYTADPGEISFLFFCYYARTAGGFDMVAGLNDAADSHAEVVVEVQSIAQGVAAELGDRLCYDSPVGRIQQDDSGVRLHTPDDAVTAEYAVVALPPALAGRIDYTPALPAARDELTQRMPTGAVVKCLLSYDEPFWREAGFSGFVEDDAGPADYFFDDGRPEGETGQLAGFICGDAAREWAARTEAARRDAITAQLVSVFENDRLGSPRAYHDRAWANEPYSRGAYHGYPTPGTMTACWDAIREPVGRLHWAGAETATKWYGHMDGAIRSGERAAAEVAGRF